MKKVFILVFVFAVLSVGSIYAYNGYKGHYQGNRSGYSSSKEYSYNHGDRGNHNRGRNNNRGDDGYNHNNRGNHNGGCCYNN